MARTYKRDSAGRFSSGGGGKSDRSNKPAKGKTAGYEQSLKNLDRINKLEQSKSKKSADRPANKIAPSPRRSSPFEKAVADVLTSSKFRSDKKRIAELSRRGFPSDLNSIATMRANILRKQKADTHKPESVKAALMRAAGKKPKK